MTVTPAAPGAAAPDLAPAPGATAAPAAPAAPVSLTLVTGDQVFLEPAEAGRWGATITPAPRASHAPVFETVEVGEDVYVIPSDAAPLIPHRLDRELFNVTKLAEYGYTSEVPVIVTGQPGGVTARAATPGVSVTTNLPSVDGYAAAVAPDGAWWETVGSAGRTAAGAGTGKVWLDEPAEIALDVSTPMVGAPQAWAAGYDGTGVTVAVLDTGIDDSHPDLAGKVVGARNFTSEADTSDLHGHGTHVAGTVAGSGAASGGTYTGVAPGADLLVGKVCDESGNCLSSEVIEGMQWAAPQADLVSLSIGSNRGSDGTDPMSQAVNTLTAAYDTLFVIAAGNLGSLGAQTIASPGAADAALTVGAVDDNGGLAWFSSYGPRLGDFAVKPDITAPGVGIVAPRAAGTAMGTPVNEFYTGANGTSMATPHVSGAAAILLQQDRDRSAAELKATLATTAATNQNLSVYQQGGGLLDIPAGLDTPVTTTPAPLDLGYFPYPHGDAAPVTAEVTYANRTGAPVELSLWAEVRDEAGDPAPAAPLSVAPALLEVPAGGTATATVTLDVDAAELGRYGGYLMAGGKAAELATPLGFFKEAEMYDLSVEGYARDGRPAAGSSSIYVMDVVSGAREFLASGVDYVDGVATVRVPPGTYHVMGNIYTYDGHDEYFQSWTMVAAPEVEVTQDTTLMLDARDATPVVVDTPAHAQAAPFGYNKNGLHRRPASGQGFAYGLVADYWRPAYALPTEPVTQGELEYYSRTRLGDAPLELAVADPVATPLDPRKLNGSPPLDEELLLPLIWAGAGAEADYAGIDAEGAAVLAVRGGPDYATKEATARAHGAAALLIMNDTTGNFGGSVGSAAGIPTMSLPGAEGELLRDLLADGAVTVHLAGISSSSYLYDVVYPETGTVPEQLHYVADPADLATVVNSFHSVPNQVLGETRHSWRPHESASIGIYSDLMGPLARTEYLSVGDTRYRLQVGAQEPNLGLMYEPITVYQAGQRLEQSWFESPLRPGLLEPSAYQSGRPVIRTGDTLELFFPEWGDSQGKWGYRNSAIDTSAFRLYQDGELITEYPAARLNVPVSPDPATYRLELDVARDAAWWPTSTAISTAWTVGSERGQTRLPILLVDYDADVDLTNTAPLPKHRSGPATLDLSVRHQQGVAGPAIASAKVWVSYDDGETWEERPVHNRGDGAYQAVLNSPDPAGTTGFVSLRIEAWDADGNGIEQEITRAWQLPAR